jgi:hypothetical protein
MGFEFVGHCLGPLIKLKRYADVASALLLTSVILLVFSSFFFLVLILTVFSLGCGPGIFSLDSGEPIEIRSLHCYCLLLDRSGCYGCGQL